jgi:hypothetical protein
MQRQWHSAATYIGEKDGKRWERGAAHFRRRVAVAGPSQELRRDKSHFRGWPHQFSIHPTPPLAFPWVGFSLGTPDNSLSRVGAKK